jgi:hypothetical protein
MVNIVFGAFQKMKISAEEFQFAMKQFFNDPVERVEKFCEGVSNIEVDKNTGFVCWDEDDPLVTNKFYIYVRVSLMKIYADLPKQHFPGVSAGLQKWSEKARDSKFCKILLGWFLCPKGPSNVFFLEFF